MGLNAFLFTLRLLYCLLGVEHVGIEHLLFTISITIDHAREVHAFELEVVVHHFVHVHVVDLAQEVVEASFLKSSKTKPKSSLICKGARRTCRNTLGHTHQAHRNCTTTLARGTKQSAAKQKRAV